MSLVSGSTTKQTKGIKEIKKIGEGDSANILSALSEKIRASDTKSITDDLLSIQCKICVVRTELIGEYF